MFKIVSHFYVIRGDDVPIYVGYTNRTVKKRFAEHKKDKDFSEYAKITVTELKDEKLEFPFTWDYNQTCENANLVSVREGDLVNRFHTQESIYQKADHGGQTWSMEKYFVKTNKNNPIFLNMSASEIKKYLNQQKQISTWLGNFIENMKSAKEVWLKSFIGHMTSAKEVWLKNFIGHMESAKERWLTNFIGDMTPAKEGWLKGFIKTMTPAKEIWLKSFIGNMTPAKEIWLKSFIGNMKPAKEIWLKNFIGNMGRLNQS